VPRLTAGERREHLVVAAMAEFAATGYHGTPTDAIARRAGISQPYLFRLYGTKKELFLACVDRCFDAVTETFRAAAGGGLEAMGEAYLRMLADRELLLFQMQAYAASADDDVRALTRRRYEELWAAVAEMAGASEEEVRVFFGQGMLLNVAATIELPAAYWDWHE
jgi:AcrR family transcriptional regulator